MRSSLLDQLSPQCRAKIDAELKRHQNRMIELAGGSAATTAKEFERHMDAIEEIMLRTTRAEGTSK